MVQKNKITRKYSLQCSSLIAIFLLVFIPIIIIDPIVAEWIFVLGSVAISIFLNKIKGLKEFLENWWFDEVGNIVHWGIISTFTLFLINCINFLRDFEIDFKIIKKNRK